MAKLMPRRLSLGGQYSAGDAGSIPDGTVRQLSNIFPRPNRGVARPPFAYDNLMSINGLANYDDRTNHVSRLVALDSSNNLYLKGTSGEAWSAAITGATNSRISSYAIYRGQLFFTTVDSSGIPNGFYSFNGSTIDTNPTRAGLIGRSVTLFNDRLYLLSPRATINNRLLPIAGVGADYPYDVSLWTPTNATAANISANGTTTGRITPTALTGASVSILGTGHIGPASASTHDLTFVWLAQLSGLSATYDVPMTMEIISAFRWTAAEAVQVGFERVPTVRNGYRYRCTTAGTTGGAEPAWPVAPGTVNDNGVVWTFVQSDVYASANITVPNISKSPKESSFGLGTVLPAAAATGAYGIDVRLKFRTLTELAPVDVSYRDGLADGDVRKANWGQQVTNGDYAFPFFNVENSISATVDMYEDIIWSDLGLSTSWPGKNTYRLTEGTGLGQASCATGGRYAAFKRGAYWIFQATTDPLIPIRREGTVHDGIGCIGPRSLDIYEDTIFFIGESDIYQMEPGDVPSPICGDGMREEIMDHGSGWAESQATYKMPILAIDKSKLIVWVYTQAGKLYAYDLRVKMWSTHSISNAAPVAAMLWNQNTGNFYVAFGGYGLTRMDYVIGAATGANDTIDSTATTYPLTMSITFKAVEIEDRDGEPHEFHMESITPRISCKIAGQAITGSYSFDGGETFPKSQTLSITSLTAGKQFKPIRLDCRQTDFSITPKITVTGKGGEAAFMISPRVYAIVEPLRELVTPENQTSGASSL